MIAFYSISEAHSLYKIESSFFTVVVFLLNINLVIPFENTFEISVCSSLISLFGKIIQRLFLSSSI